MFRWNGLLFKVFAWFWSSVALTIALLLLISNISFTELVVKPIDGRKAQGIEKLAKFIERRFYQVPSELQLKRLLHRSARKRVLFLKGATAESSVLSQPLPPDIDLNLLNEVSEQQVHYIYTENYHAIGPVLLTIDKQTYWLYEIIVKQQPPLLIKFSLLPIWIKLTTPILVSLLLSFLFTKGIVNPINRLRHTAEKIGEGQLTSRIPERFIGKDELGDLAKDVNHMATKLEASVGAQQRLLADISHELRSPLTRLSLAASMVNDADETKRQEYLNRINKEAEQLDHMIGSVLMLSRLEIEQQYLNKSSFLVADLVAPIIQDAEFEASAAGKVVQVQAIPNEKIAVDGQVVASAIENILRNAIRYAKHNVGVFFEVQQGRGSNNTFSIIIEDDGCGIPDEILTKIVEPFYRHTESRERTSGGAGLGLAIAKKAMLAHSGELILSNKASGGLKVELRFNSLV